MCKAWKHLFFDSKTKQKRVVNQAINGMAVIHITQNFKFLQLKYYQIELKLKPNRQVDSAIELYYCYL